MELTIERLGHHGDGIAPGPIFVPGTLPGEVVRGEVDGDRLDAPKIVTPSPERVRAPCPHYKRCGGCVVQHASDATVATWKTEQVRAALAAHGLEAPIRRLHTSPPASRRRATFSGRRTKAGAEVGFHVRRGEQIVPVPECLVVRPALLAVQAGLAEVTRLLGSRKGALRLTVTETDGGVDLAVSGGKTPDRALFERMADLAEAAGLARITLDGEVALTRSPPVVRFDGVAVPLPPGAFLQATVEGESALRAGVTEALDGVGPVADLFAGCGTFALPLAKARAVHAVEGDGALTDALDAGWRGATGLRTVTTEVRDLFRRPLTPDEIAPYGGVVIDPPRAGAAAQVAELAVARPARIAMVSCNPATFARDLATLTAAGYLCDWIDVVDQFRWSAHVEVVAALRQA